MGDPFVLYASDGNYYLYGTGGGAKDGFAVYSSGDLVDWKFEGRVYTGNTADSWCIGAFWAPEVYECNGKFYMFYSAQCCYKHAVGYATGKSPLGPFTKALNNPVLQKNTNQGGVVSGTGHNSITFSPDEKEMFCVYHARTKATGNKRMVFIDRMEILKGGKLVVHGQDTDPQPLPSGLEK